MSQHKSNIEFRFGVLLTMQTALLGMVTPELRGVTVEFDARRIHALFVYDGAITDEMHDIVSTVEGEVMATYVDHLVEFEAVPSSNSIRLNDYQVGDFVYKRKEWSDRDKYSK
jgi:NADH:ubiquinone oxidoreductase subunit D